MSNGAQFSRSQHLLNKWETVSAKRIPQIPLIGRLEALIIFIPLVLAISACSWSNSFAQTSPQADSTVAAIRALYDNGSYVSAELQARRVLEDKRVAKPERVQLEKYLAFALVAEGKNESAIEHFINALRIDSTLKLDPVLTSPKILSVFQTAREKYSKETSGEESNGTAKTLGVNTISRGPTFRSMIFPGWDQLYRGRKTKGFILLGTGAAAAVSAIASDVLRRNARTNYLNAQTPSSAESLYSTYNFYYKTEFYSVSAFVLIYLYSEFDAFLDLPPHFGVSYSPSSRSISLGLHVGF